MWVTHVSPGLLWWHASCAFRSKPRTATKCLSENQQQCEWWRSALHAACDLWDDGTTVVEQGEAWHRTRSLFTCAAGCLRLLCSAVPSSRAGRGLVRGPRLDQLAQSPAFTPFRPTLGRIPRTGRPGWTSVSPWLAGTRPGLCACCQRSCSWARRPPGTPGRRQSYGRTERPSVPADLKRIWKTRGRVKAR